MGGVRVVCCYGESSFTRGCFILKLCVVFALCLPCAVLFCGILPCTPICALWFVVLSH